MKEAVEKSSARPGQAKESKRLFTYGPPLTVRAISLYVEFGAKGANPLSVSNERPLSVFKCSRGGDGRFVTYFQTLNKRRQTA